MSRTIAVLSSFVLSALAFVAVDLATAREVAAADPVCPNFVGAACVNGNCVNRYCQTPGTYNSTCADLGSTCLMGYKCIVTPCVP